jgi:tetratricopeptide (TPR) repeat protein
MVLERATIYTKMQRYKEAATTYENVLKPTNSLQELYFNLEVLLQAIRWPQYIYNYEEALLLSQMIASANGSAICSKRTVMK